MRLNIAMKCIGALNGLFIWVIICLMVWFFVPSGYTTVHQNIGWALGLGIFCWWLAGYIFHCSR